MDRSKYKKVTNQSISEIKVDQDFDQIMTHLNSKNPESPITFPADTEIVLPKISLEGIVTIQKDTNQQVGLEIPGLLSINNKEYVAGEEIIGTNGNLCLLDDSADLLRINPVPVTLTYVGIVEGVKVYTDAQGLKYGYINDGNYGNKLAFIGDTSMETFSPLPISQAPIWKANSIFLFGDTQEVVPLEGILRLVFSTQNSSTIIVPQTVSHVFPNMFDLTLENFSGILDASAVTLDNSSFKYIGTNCTEGTILVNADTYANFRGSISSGMLEGKIKIQQVEGQ